jgi:protein TonB
MPEGVGAITGFVDVEIVVGADGRVAHARVSKPLDDHLDREALLAARKWRFRPATTGDRGIPMLMVLRVRFDSARIGTADAVSADLMAPPRFTPPSADLFASAVEVGPKNPGARHPKLVRNIIPGYTPEGLRAKIQGIVELQAVVMPDGTVGAVRVVKSLDSQNGLDEQAIQAAARWFFEPGTLNGTPVATMVTLTLEFRVR